MNMQNVLVRKIYTLVSARKVSWAMEHSVKISTNVWEKTTAMKMPRVQIPMDLIIVHATRMMKVSTSKEMELIVEMPTNVLAVPQITAIGMQIVLVQGAIIRVHARLVSTVQEGIAKMSMSARSRTHVIKMQHARMYLDHIFVHVTRILMEMVDIVGNYVQHRHVRIQQKNA